MCSKKALVDARAGMTYRTFADVQHDVLRDTMAGSKTNPPQIIGAPVAGHGMCDVNRHRQAEYAQRATVKAKRLG